MKLTRLSEGQKQTVLALVAMTLIELQTDPYLTGAILQTLRQKLDYTLKAGQL